MLKNFSIKKKLTLGYIAVAILASFSTLVSYYEINKVAEPIHTKIPQTLERIRRNSQLDYLAQQIRYYDEVLTQSARNYAYTEDTKWKDRYNFFVPKLDNDIKQAIGDGDEIDKLSFLSIDAANLALVDMEVRSLDFVDKGERESAIKILESQEYWDQKAIYSKGLNDYVDRRVVVKEQSLAGSIQTLDDVATETKHTLTSTVVLSGIIGLLVLVVGLLFAFLFSQSISSPINELVVASHDFAQGNLQKRAYVHSRDEIGQLSEAFNTMAQRLEKSYTELEKEVQDRTKDINQKLKEMESMNQLMVGRELKMIDLKKEIKKLRGEQS